MKELMEILINIQPVTWISIASLSISIAALIITNRRQSFDMKLIGAKKTTEIRGIFLEFKRKITAFLQAIDEWEKICVQCESYPKDTFLHYRESAVSFQRSADDCLQGLDSPITHETAIRLERITAYGDDLCKSLSEITETCRKCTEKCKDKKT